MMQTGILIIGSLLWDRDECRASWRRNRLDLENQVFVRVPIRYGRRSRTRGNTFTMVFRSDNVLGRAVLVPCLSSVKNIDDLVAEATALWKAERPSAREGEIGASWGCVGALFHYPHEYLELVKKWGLYFQNRSGRAIDPVDSDGLLRIPWPTKVDGSPVTEFDVILAVATQAANPAPKVEDIADAWINQDKGNERYFFENVRHGIRTAEDLNIWRRYGRTISRMVD